MAQDPIVFAVRDTTSDAVGPVGRTELPFVKICSGRLFLIP
jgi:hypothetical protein